jgi:hypothetical protein
VRFKERRLFYRAIQPGRNRWAAAFWCGTNAVVRVSALRDVGGELARLATALFGSVRPVEDDEPSAMLAAAEGADAGLDLGSLQSRRQRSRKAATYAAPTVVTSRNMTEAPSSRYAAAPGPRVEVT